MSHEYLMVHNDIMSWAASYEGPKFHALLCDPPYELGFMGKDWDKSGIAFNSEAWGALAKHLYPGAFGMAFASSRGWHRLAVAIEDSGLRIHPSIFGWCYGSGFPKATRIDTQVDRAAGAEREVTGRNPNARPNSDNQGEGMYGGGRGSSHSPNVTVPVTDLAQAWEGHRYGLQALKPALEPIIVFQKPYQGKPVDCITETGAGALWIDGGRVGLQGMEHHTTEGKSGLGKNVYGKYANEEIPLSDLPRYSPQGRWPANFVLGHAPGCERVGTRRVKSGTAVRKNKGVSPAGWKSVGYPDTKDDVSYADTDGLETIAVWDCVPECPVRKLGEQSGELHSNSGNLTWSNRTRPNNIYGKYGAGPTSGITDNGTAARFFFQSDWSYEIAERLAGADAVFYCAKAGRRERDAGLEGVELRYAGFQSNEVIAQLKRGEEPTPVLTRSGKLPKYRNPHPTVKPITLCRWLATLLLPPPEYAPRRLLVPFAGVGSEMIAAGLIGWEHTIGIELLAENAEIAKVRLEHWLNKPQQKNLGL
jgi:site-specific DNA-methyltransferase (adenine-specific)